jgi:hypothetical protein
MATSQWQARLVSMREIKWLVRQHATAESVGDIVYLYRCKGHTGKDGGFVAKGVAVTNPSVQGDSNAARCWLDWSSVVKQAMRVTIRLLEPVVSGRGLLSRTAPRNTDVGSQLPNLPNGQGTRFLLEDTIATWLDDLWSRENSRV